jgi:hypothetical protein
MNFSDIDINELSAYFLMCASRQVDYDTYYAYQTETGVWVEGDKNGDFPSMSLSTHEQRAKKLVDSIHDLYTHLIVDNKPDTMFWVYDVGKKFYGEKNLREFFSDIYKVLTLRNVDSGPRLGVFIDITGRIQFFNTMYQNMNAPLFWRTL